MSPPTDRQIFEGEIATYWFDDGILVSLSKSPKRTVANITENVALVKHITNNKKVALLIYLSPSPIPDKETRRFSAEQLPHVYTAMAMVSKPGLAKLIMNMFQIKIATNPDERFYERHKRKGVVKTIPVTLHSNRMQDEKHLVNKAWFETGRSHKLCAISYRRYKSGR